MSLEYLREVFDGDDDEDEDGGDHRDILAKGIYGRLPVEGHNEEIICRVFQSGGTPPKRFMAGHT